jgi:Tripartite tricarboxylate transporter TctB family
MKIKSQKDFWSGLMFVATGVGFAAGATNYSFGTSARPGPGYFPFGLGVLLAILGAAVLFKSLTIETEGGDPIGAIPWRPLGLITLAVVVFGLALPRLGMIISLPILILIASLAGDEFRLKEVLINIVVLTLGSWAIFIKGLSLVIPLWPAFMSA